MISGLPVARPLARRLGFRLALAFALALLPLGIVSSLQSQSLLKEAQARSQAALLGQTLMAVAPEANMIRAAQSAAQALSASMTALLPQPEACRSVMEKLIADAKGNFSFAAFVPVSGLASCTSNGKVLDLTTSERLKKQRLSPKPDVVVIANGAASGTSVLAFGHPVFDTANAYLGYVSISMPHKVLQDSIGVHDAQGKLFPLDPIALILFDRDGNILTSSTGIEDAPTRLPARRSLADIARYGTRTFEAVSNGGFNRVYATFPVVQNSIYAIGNWPMVISAGPLSFHFSPFLMPALMWLASLLVAVLAAERLVTRHIRVLRKSITSFAAGNHLVPDLDMPDAAIEIRDVVDSYLAMTDRILRDEAELEDMVHQREVLLREVHHRVKNNLQLIASIMNMQMRQTTSPETKVLMRNLQDRVMSLATIHRGLYQTSGLTDVRADELLSDILRQILKMATGPGLRFDLETGFDDIQLTPDQAVPLSLLLTEALTNAIKYAGAQKGYAPKLTVALRREGVTDAVLTVCNQIGAQDLAEEAGTGLGSQLMTAFTQQLNGISEITIKDGIYRLRVQFALRALAEAEAGKAPDDPDPAD